MIKYPFHLKILITILICLFTNTLIAAPSLNIYGWGGEIPMELIWKFEKETGIDVHFSTYDSNETMYAKLRANKHPIYDIIVPSSSYVERMKNQGLLTPLDHSLLPNIVNIDPIFTSNTYDPNNNYSIPLVLGSVGIFYNDYWIKNPPKSWGELWDSRWANQLLMLDDARDVFSIALLSLGFDPNNKDSAQIKEAYQILLRLVPNIKLFASDAIRSVMIDEEANLGMSWSGDAPKVSAENSRVKFIYPKEGYVLWVDCLAIPINPPHLKEAYQFINFMLNAKNSSQITLINGYAITNLPGKKLLPKQIQNNPAIFPPRNLLKKGYFQRDVGEAATEQYNQYWEEFKLAF